MRIKYLQRPGRYMSSDELRSLVEEIRTVASACFSEMPIYQCTSYEYDFRDSIITLAYDGKTLVGFSSAIEMYDGSDRFLHLGLTCVHPGSRGTGLTHKLAGRLTLEYLIRNKLFGSVWFTNIAGVISSLANVGEIFDQVYPSPKMITPSSKHLQIVHILNTQYRDMVHIDKNIQFDSDAFLFKGSAIGNMWFKGTSDTRYHHRNAKLNHYYLSRMNLDEGDEMVQVGFFNIFTFIKYLLK